MKVRLYWIKYIPFIEIKTVSAECIFWIIEIYYRISRVLGKLDKKVKSIFQSFFYPLLYEDMKF